MPQGKFSVREWPDPGGYSVDSGCGGHGGAPARIPSACFSELGWPSGSTDNQIRRPGWGKYRMSFILRRNRIVRTGNR